MSTEPNNTPVAEDQDAKAAARTRAIERARELAAKRKAQQAANSDQTESTDQAAATPDDDAKAAARARAIERARELAAKRKAQQAANSDQAEGSDQDASIDQAADTSDDAKAAARARAIERARELAAKRKAEQAANSDQAEGTDQAADATDDEAKAAAKARAIERARELAAKRKAEQAANSEQSETSAANSGKDDQADAKAQAIARARELAAARKAKQAQQEDKPAQSSGTVEGVLHSGKPKQSSLFEIFLKGIWKDNPGLCQLLGMCPLLAVTTSAANALGLGIATILVLMLSSSMIALIRRLIVPEVRIPIYVIIIAALVTVVRFEVEANFPALYQQLGIYLSLIATNCIIMGRAEAFAGHNGVIRSLVDAIASGIGFTLVLFALGSIREIVGNGTWLVGASDLLGSWAAGWEMQLYGSDYTLLIAILPPGGFFVLAFLIAAKNALDGRAKRKAERKARIDVMRI